MAVKYLKICSLDRTPICDLIDKTPMRARAIVEELSINEITTLTFELPISNPKWKNIKNENLVYFNDEYYRIKKPSFFHGDDGKLYIKVECKHYSDNLANDLISVSETTPLTVVELMKIALCYDENGKPTKGWTVGNVTVDRLVKRGLEAMEQSPFSVLLTIAEKYGGILKFNSKTMTVDMLEMQTDEHPVFDLRVAKNLKSFQITYDTTEMFTRLYCYGATDDDGNSLDIMSVNPTGKPYIDNFDYFYNLGYSKDFVENHPELFVNTNIWRDDNYYDAQDLYNDGIKELAKIAQPVVNVEVSALDSKTLGEEADVTKFDLGACIRVIDEDIGADTMCNVVKRTINYEQPHILDMEVTSSVVYHDTLSKLFTNVNTASAVVTSGGNLVGGQGVSMSTVIGYLDTYYINAEQIKAKYASIETLTTQYLTSEQIKATYIDANAIAATYATIGSLNAIEAQIKDLDVTRLNAKVAEIEELTAQLADFDKLIADSAEIEKLKADNITVVGKLTASQAEIDTIKATYAQIGSFEAYKGAIENLTSINAEIESLKSKYINALELEVDSAKIAELEAAIANIETLEASMATIEKLTSETIITDDISANRATIDNLEARLANINTLIANVAEIDDLRVANAKIELLNAEHIDAIKVDVEELNAKSATISQLTAYTLLSDFGKFQNLTAENLKTTNATVGKLDANLIDVINVLAGAVGTGLLQTIHLTAENVVIDDAVIKSAMIDNIDTDLVRVGNDNIIISGSTQQFKDSNGVVRIQIGQDAEGNFTFIVADEDGATIIGANGITEKAVPNGLIVNKMVSDDAAIEAKKIKFVDSNNNTTLQTYLEIEQGRIDTLIKETTIEDASVSTGTLNEDGVLVFDNDMYTDEDDVLHSEDDPLGVTSYGVVDASGTVKLKDAYNQTVQTVDGIQTAVAKVQTDIEGINSQITDIKVTAEGITTEVSKVNNEIGAVRSIAEQNAEQFKWVVKDGTNESNFILTDRTAELVAQHINIKGLVAFSGLNSDVPEEILKPLASEPANGSTIIHGGNILTNTITSKQVSTEEFFSNEAVISKINSYEVKANRIIAADDGSKIKGFLIDATGLEVKQQGTDIVTFQVENTGDVTMRGTVESYNYVSGKTGWAIKSDGNAEFNDVTVRGSVISNYGGIASCGGSGENLQRDTSFTNGTISSYWQNSSGLYSVDTGVLCDGVKSIKYSRSGISENSSAQMYTHLRNNRIIPVEGKLYTASAKFYTKDYSSIDGTKPTLGIWFYNENEDGTFNKISAKTVEIPFVNNEWVDVSVTLDCPEGAEYMSIVVTSYRNGTYWFAQPKLEQNEIATAWSLSPLDGIRQVIHWAGSTYEERESAPWIVYNDGSMIATKGTFGGVFTGNIEIGNISIVDPSNASGNDAILTIQNGNNGVKAVQLRDANQSDFAQNINITDNFYNTKILFTQDGVGNFSNSVVVGDENNSTSINNDSININNSIINATDNGMKVLSNSVTFGSASASNNVEVWGSTTLQGQLNALGDINIGNKLKVNVKSNGVDIDFVN